MEKQIFDWEDWNNLDTAAFQFIDCTIKEDFGPLKKGETYQSISVDFENGFLEAFNEEKPLIKVNLKLTVA